MKSFPWETLLEWYKKHGRHDLPWRNYEGSDIKIAYQVWISEIFLQQTQVERVKGYFERVMTRYPTIEKLAQANYEEFFPYYQGLGYYSRARNILKTAKIITEEYSMIFPTNENELINLPGVGPYTAEAIKAFGYGIPTLSWDTNLEKVFSRYYFGSRIRKLSKEEKGEVGKNLINYIESESKGELRSRKKLTREVNNALMDFSSLVDKNELGKIIWDEYIFQESLFYIQKGIHEPVKEKKSISFPTPDAQIKVILHQDHKEYYSENKENYTPFILNPSLTRDTRAYVQDFFRKHYGLELSVRPVHKKWISDEGKPYIEVNAQIQVGEHTFYRYSKHEMIESGN